MSFGNLMDVMAGPELAACPAPCQAAAVGTWHRPVSALPQVLVMTHAAKPPPDGQNGPMDYDAYINHRMNALQQGVRSALCPPPFCPA